MVIPQSCAIAIPDGACPPDSAHSLSGYPAPDFVVSRLPDGTPLSLYRHTKWDLSPYSARSAVIYLDHWDNSKLSCQRSALLDDARKLLFLVGWRRPQGNLAVSTMVRYGTTVRAMTKFAHKFSLNFDTLLSDVRVAKAFVAKAGRGCLSSFIGFIKLIYELGTKKTGFSCMPKTEWKQLHKIRRELARSDKQHAPVPTRIYCNLILALQNELRDYEQVEEEILYHLRQIANNPFYGRTRESQQRVAKTLNYGEISTYENEIKDIISESLKNYLLAHHRPLTVYGIISAVSAAQFLCKLTIHVFSGARDKEADSLPYNCHQLVTENGCEYHLLYGTTTKRFKGLPGKVFWVSSSEGYRAVQIAQRICDVISSLPGSVEPNSDYKDGPLFLSTGYFFRGSHRPKRRNLPGRLTHYQFRHALHAYDLVITDEDLNELEEIDPHRAWRSEPEFAVGKPWPLSTHQLRRSLAVFGTSSGYVQLTSLRRQLHQITAAMAEYYASGSQYAKNLLAIDDTHMCAVYQATQHESEALSFISNILLSPEKTFGPLGTWSSRHILNAQGILTSETRESVMKQFKNGELAYRETFLGGCSETGPCRRRAMRSFVSCLDCKRAGIKLSKLNRAIAEQEIFLESLSVESVEYVSERATLDVLLSKRDEYQAT